VYQWLLDGTQVQPGTNSYLLANISTNHSLLVTFAAKADQQIVFAPLSDATYGDPPFALNASASSGLPVIFSVISGPVSITGSNILSIFGAGLATIQAAQGGNSDYNPATNIGRALNINKATQTISFAPLANKALGEPPFVLNASASSGLPVLFNILSGPALIFTNAVTIIDLGLVSIRGSQSGDSNFNAAPFVDASFTVFEKPILKINRLQSDLILSWSSNVPGFNLQIATNITPPSFWFPVAPAPTIIDAEFRVTNTITSGSRFYRLTK
jgi:hypothetical protein